MNRLNDQEWSLITRYLKAEVTSHDHERLQTIWLEYPALKSALDELNDADHNSTSTFDAMAAFKKLHQRFQEDNLL